jgi:hypothetical protein
MARRTQTWSRRKLLRFAAVTVALLLLLAEGLSRVVFLLKFRGLGTSVYVQGSPIQEVDSASVYNNRAFYVDFEKGFQYNELGMKSACGDYRMPVKADGDLWVLLLGASAMEGMGSNKDGAWFDMTNIADHPYNETIAYFLEERLRRVYPGKRVRVFNAAVSGFTLEQGIAKYKALAQRYDFDWVISMDGVNECDTLETEDLQAVRAYSRAYWASMPFRRFPLNWIVSITQHSAFFNLLKQSVYHMRLNRRMQRNRRRGFPERSLWAHVAPEALLSADGDERVRRSADFFIRWELAFAGELEREGKKYLLLAQPYLAFRDSTVLGAEELALNHYLRTAKNDGCRHAFLRAVYEGIDGTDSLRGFAGLHGIGNSGNLNIRTMSGVNRWPGWVFVDYCHFTKAANERIAAELADYIATDGKMKIFK